MNILVISSYFGPETSVGVLRVNAFVKYWAKLGHFVHVITMPFSGLLPEGIADNERIEVSQVSPLFIKNLTAGDIQGFAKGATGFRRKIVKFQYWLKRKYFSNYLDPRLLWWPKAARHINTRLMTNMKFDFLISTVPSYTAHSAAALVKMVNKNLIWVADYRDLWSGNPIFPGIRFFRLIERNHERFILKGADLIVSINDALVSELAQIHGRRKYCVVPNGFEDYDVDLFRKIAARKFSTRISIVYTGSILPGLQNPTPLFKAIKELAEEGGIREGDLGVYFYGDYSALNDYSLSSNETVSKFIVRCGRVPKETILRIQRGADFLLFLGSTPVVGGIGSTTGVVSGKIFEYLISGTEVMAVGVNENMIVADMIKKGKVGDFYGEDVEKLKKRIIVAVGNGVQKVTPDMIYLNQFRRSILAGKLLSEVQNIISGEGQMN